MNITSFKPVNEIRVRKNALVKNYQYLQQAHPHSLIAPVIKSNAYGHGLVHIAKAIDTFLNAPYLCVDNLNEAQILSKNKIRTPILVLGGNILDNYRFWKKIPYTLAIFDPDSLKTLNTHQPGIRVHIKIDTGMNRLGLKPEDVESFIRVAKKMNNIEFEGIFTHLAQADQKEGDLFTQKQINTFKEVLGLFRHYGFLFKWRHVSNTAGISRIKDPDFNLSRVGLGFYGYSPFPKTSILGKKQRQNLLPALSLTSRLIHIKHIAVGEQVSYNGTFIASQAMVIGVIPIGYHDGIDPRLSNRGFVSIENITCPIIGKVCMNMTIIDLSSVTNPFIGQEVTVISSNQKDQNSLDNLAKIAGLNQHNLLAGLHSNLPISLI